MKTCSVCKQEKEEAEFFRRTSSKSGLCSYCKVCDSIKRRAHYLKNPEMKRATAVAWAKKNPDYNREYSAQYRAKDPEQWRKNAMDWYRSNRDRARKTRKIYAEKHAEESAIQKKAYRLTIVDKLRETRRQHYRLNKSRYLANAMGRKKYVKRATPPWADHEAIVKFYELRDTLSEQTGIQYHVDHIVPLRSKFVCGLHVPANLQVIPAVDNLSKGCNLIGI